MISKARLKYLRSLTKRKGRRQEGQLLLEGVHLAEEAAAAGKARELFVTDEAADRPQVQALIERGLPVTAIDAAALAELAQTESPSGLLTLADDPCEPLDVGTLPREAFVLVAAGVADPGNLGSLIRSAAALGLAAVVTTPGTVEPANGKVVRASAGAIYRVPVRTG
ncbi:MAG: RNA methyltransferase, partial [Planctomycetota bacterium]|nr:RNA methyltransferase [Planctomycetota bacterium]